MNTRVNNLDVLRVLAAFMVVLLHVSGEYVTGNIESPNVYFTVGNFFDSIARVSVPIFVMLSGTFLLDNPNNKEYRSFYQKSIKKIIVPTLSWSLIFCIYSLLIQLVKSLISDDIVTRIDYIRPFILWIKGQPFYHLWYMYMLMGLYLISPIMIRLKDDIGEKNTLKLGIALICLGMITTITSTLFWPIKFIEYLGYFILGYSLRKYYNSNAKRPHGFIIVSIISALTVFSLTEIIVRMGWFLDRKLYFYGNLTPFVIIGAISLFVAFVNMKEFKFNINNLAQHSFNIYIIHAGILDVISLITHKILNIEFNPIWYIPVMTIVIFGLSYIGSLIVSWILEWKILKIIRTKVEEIIIYN